MKKHDWKWLASLAGIAVLTAGFLWLAKRPCTDIVPVSSYGQALPVAHFLPGEQP